MRHSALTCSITLSSTINYGGGRVVRWCWVNFQCRGVLLIWIIVGQGLTALAVGADRGCLNIFPLIYHFFSSPSLWETARYRLKYCLKGPLSPKTTNQPTINYDGCGVTFRKRNVEAPDQPPTRPPADFLHLNNKSFHINPG